MLSLLPTASVFPIYPKLIPTINFMSFKFIISVAESYAVASLCALRTGRKGLSAAFLCHGQFAGRIIFVSLYKIVCGSAKPRLVKLCFPFLPLLSSFTIFAVCSCVFIGCGPYVGKHCVEMSLVMIRCAQTQTFGHVVMPLNGRRIPAVSRNVLL